MCGIAGMFSRKGSPVELSAVVRMTRSLVHRGPDEEGFFVNAPSIAARGRSPIRRLPSNSKGAGNVALGHRRLSIIDLKAGQQPLCNEDGTVWISFNGEIYNFSELIVELEGEGHTFRTRSDTEAIVHAYEHWGVDCLQRFRGMFAFAIWDENRHQLFLARDRVGKKPLYYSVDRDRFIFGSEIKSLIQSGNLSLDLDHEALSDYLSLLYIPAPKSIFKSVRKLPAAHYALVTADRFVLRQYWDISFASREWLTHNRVEDDLLAILDEATRLRMVSEVPLGAFLSGGLDSSAVVALMSKASQEPVKTNSISFPNPGFDEAVYARELAALFGADHREFLVEPDAVRVIEELAWHYDEPFADSSAAPTYYVSKMTRDRVTVALSGDGGDENFAGYRRYYFDQLEQRIRMLLPGTLRRPLFGALGFYYPKADYLPRILRGKTFLSNIARDPAAGYCFSMSAFKEDAKARLLQPYIRESLCSYQTEQIFRDLYEKAPAEDHLSKLQYIDIKTYLPEQILTKVDRASMAVSLEVRCPLLDHKFMEFAASIPPSDKLVGRDGKHVFKQAVARFLPKEMIWRPKMGFSMPIHEWFRGSLSCYLRTHTVEGAATAKYLNRNYVNTLYSQHMSRGRDWSTELWAVLMLNLWDARFSSATLSRERGVPEVVM